MRASHPGAEAVQPAPPQRPGQIEPATAVWVWDGSWWPATVTRALVHHGERLLIVRFEHGLTAPARPASLKLRDPDLRGADKPCPSVRVCGLPKTKALATERSMLATPIYLSGEVRNVCDR